MTPLRDSLRRIGSDSHDASVALAAPPPAASPPDTAATEREAEARRDAYFSAGTDEGGRSFAASSDARSWSPMSTDDPQRKAAERTAALDPPLVPDRIGNAIAGGLAGGALRAASTLAVEGAASALGVVGVVARSLAQGAAKGAAADVVKRQASVPYEPTGASEKRAPAGAPPAPPAGVGRSGPAGTSDPVVEPAETCVPPPYTVRG